MTLIPILERVSFYLIILFVPFFINRKLRINSCIDL